MITQRVKRKMSGSTWMSILGDAETDPDPVAYRISPLADLQWRAAIEWAGHYEVALHGVGDPAARTLLYFACGEQDVSTGMCETSSQGIAQIASRASEDGLRVLCQVHHHPFAARNAADEWDPDARFSLSSVDYHLLDQLSADLLSDVLEIEEIFRSASVTLRISDATELQMGGQRYSVMDQGSAEMTICNAELKSFRGVGDVFVGVTASDGLIHGKVLRTRICGDCAQPVRRTLHPLLIEIDGTDLAPAYQKEAFVPDDWEQVLDDAVNLQWVFGRRKRSHGKKTVDYGGEYADGWYDTGSKGVGSTRKYRRSTVSRLRRCVRELEREDVAECDDLRDEIRELAARLDELTAAGSEIDDCDSGPSA